MSASVTPISLRPCQICAIRTLQRSLATGHRASPLVLSIGSGKTQIFTPIAPLARRERRRALVVPRRRELFRHACKKPEAVGVPLKIVTASVAATAADLVQVGLIASLVRRLAKLPEFNPITVTLERLDGHGLGISAGGCCDDLIIRSTVIGVIPDRHLDGARIFADAAPKLFKFGSRAKDFTAQQFAMR